MGKPKAKRPDSLDAIFDEIEEKLEKQEKRKRVTDLQKAHDKGLTAAVEQFFKTLYLRQFVADFMDEGVLPPGIKLNDEQVELVNKAYEKNSTKSPFYLVTINPRSDVTFDQLHKVVGKIVKKKTIPRYAFVYEVRAYSDEDGYTGLHCHMLLESTIKPYDFKKGIKSSAKHICDYNNPHILNFKNVEYELLSQKYDYLLGQKSEKKQQGVELSKAYREEYGLPAIFESIPPLPCRDAQELLEIEEIQEEEKKADD